MTKVWGTVAVALAIASSFLLGYAINDLANGVSELPQHWWSTAPVLGLFLAAGLAVGLRQRGRPDRHN